MASIDLEVSVESVVHDMLLEMAEKIGTKYGVHLESVNFQWVCRLTVSGPTSILTSVQVTSFKQKS